jgi:serine phosphatase RsbU (regulator of sigma subunit)
MSTVFHLDNSRVIMKFFQSIFSEKGIEYLVGQQVQDLYNVLESRKIDLVITAMELDDISCEDLLNYLTAEYPELPVIVMTSSDSIELREQMFLLGAIDIISKSDSRTKLIQRIERLTESLQTHENLRGAKIAVLDDNTTALMVMKRVLEFYKIPDVKYYRYAAELLKDETRYDIYLIDVVLIDASGEQVIAEVRDKNPNAVIMAVSSIDHYKAISSILLIGANDYIIKPYNESILIARMSSNYRSFLLGRELQEKNNELYKKDFIISQDLSVARQVQENVMSINTSAYTDIETALYYKPLIEVGGDVWDICRLSDQLYRIFIADATGHGIQAALITMLIKNEYDKIKMTMPAPDDIMNELNRTFYNRFYDLIVLFTACVVDVDLKRGLIRYSNAGHPRPFVVSEGNVRGVSSHGTLIGVMPDIEYELYEEPFKKGDTILMYSDGLYEDVEKKTGQDGSVFIEKIINKYKSLEIEDLMNKIVESALDAADHDIEDDIMLMIVRSKL